MRAPRNRDGAARSPWRAAALAAVALSAAVSLMIVATRGTAEPRALDERVREVAETLRCPVCQNLSVADSPSKLAEGMRREIERDLSGGKSPEAIRQEFVAAYGEWILQAPPKRGVSVVAWTAPVFLLAAGGVVAWRALRRSSRAPLLDATPRLSGPDRAVLERALAEEDGGRDAS